MKKAIAMLLATTTALSLGVTALAEDVSSSEASSSEVSSSEASSSEASSSEVSSSEASSSEVSSSEVSSSEASSSQASSSQAETPVGDPTAFQFDADEDGAILGTTILEPGTEYKFPAYVTIGGQKVAITDKLLETYKFSYTRVSSKSVKTFKIDDYKGIYYLYVETKDGTPTEEIDLKYNIKLVKKSDNLSLFTQQVKFSYGYTEASGDYINGLDKGDEVEIDNSNPVINEDQFEKIAKINDYKNVTLSGPSWKFTVNVTDEGTKNLVSSNAGIKAILAQFPEQDFKFYKFAGKPAFAATGTVALDVEDIVDEFDNMYTYRYADGKLYRINATYNEEEDTLDFRTRTLDNFLVTNKLIKDGTVIEDADVDDDDTSSDVDDTDDGKGNPTTGASDMINAAVMAAIASLAAAGTIVCKKLSK